ncbi:hypothetical protein EXIGLDRAFT_319351 [Exidia glandulosa HHB12029]|uniref:Uncharacterized protein n=1 Tax=Exidia glandulosa HHB12029 TaxID=1314781 RepID=A0A165Q479_EXIGL|nr:hypothetical protein EXIGLDRAFT_319351 [Exidia glandulosa HHB12029]
MTSCAQAAEWDDARVDSARGRHEVMGVRHRRESQAPNARGATNAPSFVGIARATGGAGRKWRGRSSRASAWIPEGNFIASEGGALEIGSSWRRDKKALRVTDSAQTLFPLPPPSSFPLCIPRPRNVGSVSRDAGPRDARQPLPLLRQTPFRRRPARMGLFPGRPVPLRAARTDSARFHPPERGPLTTRRRPAETTLPLPRAVHMLRRLERKLRHMRHLPSPTRKRPARHTADERARQRSVLQDLPRIDLYDT